jgi:hypothetical protein
VLQPPGVPGQVEMNSISLLSLSESTVSQCESKRNKKGGCHFHDSIVPKVYHCSA